MIELGRHLSIDEMMIGTICYIFLQHLPKKSYKFGIKVLVNSEAKTGYVLSFDIYTGKSALRDMSTSVYHSVVM